MADGGDRRETRRTESVDGVAGLQRRRTAPPLAGRTRSLGRRVGSRGRQPDSRVVLAVRPLRRQDADTDTREAEQLPPTGSINEGVTHVHGPFDSFEEACDWLEANEDDLSEGVCQPFVWEVEDRREV